MMFFKELKKNTLSTAFTGMSDAFIQVFISIKSLAKPVVKNSGLNLSSFLETIGWSCQADIFHAICVAHYHYCQRLSNHLTINSTFVRS